jgi:hypothetical protein
MHYLVKWAGWPLKYNSYEPASHLANAPKAVADFERTLKRKRKEADTAGDMDDNDDEELEPRKRARR